MCGTFVHFKVQCARIYLTSALCTSKQHSYGITQWSVTYANRGKGRNTSSLLISFKVQGLWFEYFNIALYILESSRSLHVRFVLYRAYKVSILSQRPASLTPNGFLVIHPTEYTNKFQILHQTRLHQNIQIQSNPYYF